MRASLRSVLAGGFALALCAGGAAAQSLPTLEQYPLRDRMFGTGGAFFPDYVNPSEHGVAYVTGVPAARGAIFAVGTTDFNCQQTQVPTIQVLNAPAGGKVSIGYGSFRATRVDAGTTRCLGRTLKGLVVTYKGRRAPGQTVALRVTYPVRGAWYDHVVPVSAQ